MVGAYPFFGRLKKCVSADCGAASCLRSSMLVCEVGVLYDSD